MMKFCTKINITGGHASAINMGVKCQLSHYNPVCKLSSQQLS